MNYRSARIDSQCGQDAFVLDYFNNKRNGTFVDIGANDGKSLSNTYYLEKQLGWTGICFEPIPEIFEKLDNCRSCIKIMAGVSDKTAVETFTYVDGPSHMLSGMTKAYSETHQERGDHEIETLGGTARQLDLPCVLLNNVLEEHKMYAIDYLSLDTEGNELDILKAIDFSRFDIKVMTVENNYQNKEQTEFVLSKGYKLVTRLDADEVFVKLPASPVTSTQTDRPKVRHMTGRRRY